MPSSSKRRIIAAGTIGNVLEWYDFSIYGYFATAIAVVALGFNSTFGIVGGLTPLVATWLVHRTDDDISPAFMIMAAAVISFAAVLTLRKRCPELTSVAPP